MLIVEDERWEREGLVQFLDWNSLGIEIAGTAVDGMDGCEKALELRPDIIVTDIRMPGMNGLDMVKRIRADLPDVRVIVLTGYSDFEYTREALYLDADDYVLKPVEEEDMIRSARRAVKECERLRYKRQEELNIRRRLQTGERMAVEKLLADLLHDRMDEGRAERELLDRSDELRAVSYGVLVLASPEPIEEERIRQMLNLPCYLTSCDAIPGGSAVILPMKEPSIGAEEAASRLMEEWESVCPSPPTIGTGKPADDFPKLKDAYRQALNAAQFGMFYGQSGIVTAEMEERARLRFSEQAHGFLSAWQEMSRQIRLRVLALQEKEIGEQLDRIMKSIRDAPGAGKDYVAALLNALMIDLSMLVDNRGGGRGRIQQLLVLNRLSDMRDYVQDFIAGIVRQLEARRSSKDEYIADKVIRLIDEKYGTGEIGLTTLADEVFVSPNHLNALFKKVTGRTVHQYLTDVRMSRAEELLRTTKLKVSEVAGRIGMTNISYFISMFKQEYGMTPGDYQEFMQRK